MKCDEARSRLLTADLADPAPELEQHLRACPECRQIAEELRSDERALSHALNGAESELSVDEAAERAARSDSPADASPDRRRFWVPLAAAALLLLALGIPWMLQQPGPESVEPAASTPDQHRTSVKVEVPRDRRMAIMHTSHPNITVVWFQNSPTRSTP